MSAYSAIGSDGVAIGVSQNIARTQGCGYPNTPASWPGKFGGGTHFGGGIAFGHVSTGDVHSVAGRQVYRARPPGGSARGRS